MEMLGVRQNRTLISFFHIILAFLMLSPTLIVPTSAVYAAADVPFFSQKDPGWKDDYVGSSGKTIEQIGCAMTITNMLFKYYDKDAYVAITLLGG